MLGMAHLFDLSKGGPYWWNYVIAAISFIFLLPSCFFVPVGFLSLLPAAILSPLSMVGIMIIELLDRIFPGLSYKLWTFIRDLIIPLIISIPWKIFD